MKKYQIFIDIKKQKDFCNQKNTAKYINVFAAENIDFLEVIDTEKKFFLLVKETTVNSSNKLVKELFEKNTVPLDNLYYVSQIYKEVIIYDISVVEEKLLPADTLIVKENIKLFNDIRNKIPSMADNKKVLHFMIIEDMLKFLHRGISKKFKTRFKDLISSQSFIKDENFISKYRLFLEDRLLVERFFPENLTENKVLVENVHLEINQPKQLKLVSDTDLYISKIIQDSKTFYPNSTEFILEP